VSPDSIYDTSYFEGTYYNYLDDKYVAQNNFRKRKKTIERFIKGGELLEIGSAYGFFLEVVKNNFEVFGIDIGKEGMKYARENLGIKNAVSGNYLEKEYPKDFFDLVCMFDTIEHLKQPDLFLLKANKELKTDGLICITTGDIDSLAARIQKKSWRLINPPTHLFYFSFKTLSQLLENSGFEVINRTYPGYSRSLASMLYLMFMKKKNAFSESAFFKMLQKVPIYLNLFDIMFVIAKKKRGVDNGD